jgi:hypothetical protein
MCQPCPPGTWRTDGGPRDCRLPPPNQAAVELGSSKAQHFNIARAPISLTCNRSPERAAAHGGLPYWSRIIRCLGSIASYIGPRTRRFEQRRIAFESAS